MSYFRKNIEAMQAYVPGEQPAPGERVIKLNTNENPYPPSPRALRALGEFDGRTLRAYPDAMAGDFRRAAAKVLGVGENHILPGNGSDDLIVMLCRAAAAPGRRIVYPVPTFTFYVTQGRIQDAECIEVPLDADFRLPVDGLADADGALTLVASPNSPTGRSASTEALDELAGRLRGLLVVDEAYVDFAESSALELVDRHENVVILRSLSKGYSLAGLRLGFAVARPEVLAHLAKAKQIYNVGALPCALGAAAMEDQAYKDACVAKVTASRAWLSERLGEMGFSVLRSDANFLLARAPEGQAEQLQAGLKQRGILVRYYKQPRLDDKLRITVGTDAENAALVEALKELIQSG